jgi:hypothetical protein
LQNLLIAPMASVEKSKYEKPIKRPREPPTDPTKFKQD